jgi:hypothetical protein
MNDRVPYFILLAATSSAPLCFFVNALWRDAVSACSARYAELIEMLYGLLVLFASPPRFPCIGIAADCEYDIRHHCFVEVC